jgi:hypothetical protein
MSITTITLIEIKISDTDDNITVWHTLMIHGYHMHVT